MNYEIKFTNKPLFPIAYAGYWNIQTMPYYMDNENLLDQADYENAPYNALLFSYAPKMFGELQHCVEVLKLNSSAIAIDIVNRIEQLLKDATTLPNE